MAHRKSFWSDENEEYEIPIRKYRNLKTITDEYENTSKCLGRGHDGIVELWINKTTKKEYAVKTIKMDPFTFDEACLHYRLSICENIVNILDIFTSDASDANLHLVMEYMAGGTLFDYISNMGYRSYNERKASFLMYQIFNAIDFMHSFDIAHRDIKPENIMLTSNGPHAVVKIGDLGVAKKYSIDEPFQTPNFHAIYSAPEILTNKIFDKSCDMWSLGVLMYILLFCVVPFKPTAPRDAQGSPSPSWIKNACKGVVSYPSSCTASKPAKELMEGLMNPNPKDRLTIKDVMQSEWVENRASVAENLILSFHHAKQQKDVLPQLIKDYNDAIYKIREKKDYIDTIYKMRKEKDYIDVINKMREKQEE